VQPGMFPVMLPSSLHRKGILAQLVPSFVKLGQYRDFHERVIPNHQLCAWTYSLTRKGRQNARMRVPGGIRTHNLLIRSQLLYPVELQTHFFSAMSKFREFRWSCKPAVPGSHRSIPIRIAPATSSHPIRRQNECAPALSPATKISARTMPVARKCMTHSRTRRFPIPFP
jgi:hypothetical protein